MAPWIVSALSGGIAMEQTTKLPLPDPERLRTTILVLLRRLI
jgi:hypothetical protein